MPDPAPQQQVGDARPSATFRLPSFAPDEADLWLVQVDCAFDVAGINDNATKFKLLVANLPVHVASQVRDVITASPPSFDQLVAALRTRLAQSRASRLQELLRDQQLGDQQPTQLLRGMQHALGGSQDDTGLLRTLFLQRLPQTTRAALALLPEATALDDLAAAADRFQEASRGAVVAAAVPAAVPAPSTEPACKCRSTDADLAAAVAALTATVARLETGFGRRPARDRRRSQSRPRGGRDRSRPGTPGTTEERQTSSGELCWYHQRFGADAHRCRQPCAWQQGN